MPNRRFLEEYPLYWRMDIEISLPYGTSRLDGASISKSSGLIDVVLEKPAIHMSCAVCSSEQTFNMEGTYSEAFSWIMFYGSGPKQQPVTIPVASLFYRCTACQRFIRFFAVRLDLEKGYIMKVGQEPSWEIAMDRALEKTLGTRANYYKRGLVSESQGYGIGAFGYYRRVVEEIIDDLLEGIPYLMAGEEREQYLEALEKTKKTTVAQEKIDLVKDLLPSILRPGGINPLSVLYSTLSEGLHKESDERCIELAAEVRETLVFLVNQIEVTKESSARFTDSMRRLLDRGKSEGSSRPRETP